MTGPSLVGCILAGGLARRMGGGDKPLLEIHGRTMLERVIDRLAPQVGATVLNANGDPQRFARFALPVVPDPIDGFAGPLAGVLAGLDWARANAPEAEGIVSVAGDTPFFPTDLVARLMAARGADPERIVLARSGGKLHPVFGYWPLARTNDLRAFLEAGETRKVLAFVDAHPNTAADFDTAPQSRDPFFNVNTPDDLALAAGQKDAGS